jgi:hypothetical protein
VLVSALVAGCGSSSPARLDTAHVARAIARTILAQTGVTVIVDCPAPPLLKPGLAFRCVAKLAVGSYLVNVVEISAKGAVRYSSDGPLRVLDSTAIEHAIAASIRRQRHLAATVDCPSPVLQRAGLAFVCVASTTRGSLRFTVTETDGDAHVSIVDQSARHPTPASHRTATTTHTHATTSSHHRTTSTTRSHTTTSARSHTATHSHTTTSTHSHTG